MRYVIGSSSNRPGQGGQRTGSAQFLAALAFATTGFLQASGADAQFHTKGRWIGPDTLGLEGTHLMVMRDVADDTTKVLLLGGAIIATGQKLWSFRASDSVSRPVLSGAGANLIGLGPPEVGANLFCSGHATLGDGRGIIIGGEQIGQYGTELAFVVDPRYPDGTSQAWTKQATMAQERWYPNATTLADGNILATAGLNHTTMVTFGGTTGTPYGELRPLNLSGAAWWGDSITSQDRPSARSGHSTVFPVQGYLTALFGGDDNGASSDGKLRDVWLASRNGDDSTWAWGQPQVQWDPITGNLPARRSQHTAVLYSARGFPPTDSMIVFGGQDSSGQALGDLWLGRYVDGTWRWYSMNASGGPGPRYGHTAVLDLGPPGSADGSRMLVFGGRGTTGSLADNSVWAFFPPTSARSARWSQVVVSGGPPLPRAGHVAVFDNKPRSFNPPKRRMIVFGGSGADSLMNNIWELSRSHLSPGDTVFVWIQLQPTGGPTPRSDAAAAYDQQWDRIDLFGGSTAAGYTGETWAFRLAAQFQADADSMWIPLPMRTNQFHPAPPARAGLSVVFDRYTPTSRYPERFNPGPAGPPPGAWSTISSPQVQISYSFTFLLPNGKLFYGGPSTAPYRYLLDLAAGWGTSQFSDAEEAGSAVMYRPGKVLRCGKRAYAEGVTGSSRTDTIALTPPNWTDSGWQEVTTSPQHALAPRANPNLTMLPTGDVLVTGGTYNDSTPEMHPQIWSVATATWTDTSTLAKDPALRNYHAAAALLPDARILSTGGDIHEGGLTNPNALKATIFEPPYLFNATDGYAARPVIGSVPRRLRYGAQFSVCLSSSDSISNVCLIRPGAVTHGFDQNQLYVPITFTPTNFPATRLTVTAPADSFLAPSGDYMLFIVNKKGVPSVARWVRMGASWPEGDVTRPARITDLTTDFVTNNSISLYWTAVGDDGGTGTASYADLRRSTSPIDSLNFNSATAVNPQPVPVCAGTFQFHNVTGLLHSKKYYFAIKFSDESGNLSLFGNMVSATTLFDCCQGERAVLAREGGTSAGGARGAEGNHLASPTGATPSGATTGGSPFAIEAVPQTGGLDVRLLAIADGSLEGDARAGASGVLLQTSDGFGKWTTLGQYDLPPGDRIAAPVPDRTTRWVLLEPLTVETVLPEVSGSGTGWILDEARHSRDGDVTEVLSVGGAVPAMIAGDTLSAHYAPAAGAAAAPAWLVVVDRPSVSTTRAHAARRPATSAVAPKAFALLQNLPNPFATTTTIGFTLPVASRVQLEVYDLLGRRVRTLANAFYPAGEHQVGWNRRTASGSLASPGLYFYRIEAGQYREKKRMLLLP
jgi:hypothetical protein